MREAARREGATMQWSATTGGQGQAVGLTVCRVSSNCTCADRDYLWPSQRIRPRSCLSGLHGEAFFDGFPLAGFSAPPLAGASLCVAMAFLRTPATPKGGAARCIGSFHKTTAAQRPYALDPQNEYEARNACRRGRAPDGPQRSYPWILLVLRMFQLLEHQS
jgi:hypothetical protein